MDIGETERIHEIEPTERDVAPEEAPDALPAFTPAEPVEEDTERERVPA